MPLCCVAKPPAVAKGLPLWRTAHSGHGHLQNLPGHNAIINALACNAEGVLVSGADNGTLRFWDYRTGHNFQSLETTPQPGSLDSEAGIYQMTFDRSGSRLITAEADKTIKIYRENPDSVRFRGTETGPALSLSRPLAHLDSTCFARAIAVETWVAFVSSQLTAYRWLPTHGSSFPYASPRHCACLRRPRRATPWTGSRT